MFLCPHCAAHLKPEATGCTICGLDLSNAQSKELARNVSTDPLEPFAADPKEKNEPIGVPAILALRIHHLDARSPASQNSVRLGFFIGIGLSVLLGLAAIFLLGPSSENVLRGCMFIVLSPLIGILGAVGFGCVSPLVEVLMHCFQSAVDPRLRQANRTLERLKEGDHHQGSSLEEEEDKPDFSEGEWRLIAPEDDDPPSSTDINRGDRDIRP